MQHIVNRYFKKDIKAKHLSTILKMKQTINHIHILADYRPVGGAIHNRFVPVANAEPSAEPNPRAARLQAVYTVPHTEAGRA